MCLEKVYIVSKYVPRSFGHLSNFTSLSAILTGGCIFASFVSGVKSVTVDFSGDTIKFLSARKSMSLVV